MKSYVYILASLLGVVSCKNSIEEIKVSEDAQKNTELADSQLVKGNNPFEGNNANQLNFQMERNAEGVVLNPPHGQPGHRCDIAVGAPLPNATAGQTAINPVQEGETLPQVSAGTQNVQVVQNQPLRNEKGELLNPPHGQPGHRCEIPVGAPLNSKPVATSANTENSQAIATEQVTVLPQQEVAQNNTTLEGFSGKPNPPHGEVGHRCDIAVGAILP